MDRLRLPHPFQFALVMITGGMAHTSLNQVPPAFDVDIGSGTKERRNSLPDESILCNFCQQ
jgi:hypothetical protein